MDFSVEQSLEIDQLRRLDIEIEFEDLAFELVHKNSALLGGCVHDLVDLFVYIEGLRHILFGKEQTSDQQSRKLFHILSITFCMSSMW